jgi:signal transduction histidine kinase
MPKEKLASLFQDFSKLEDKNNKNTQGRGLGLSIVKQIVERMDGSVHVDSDLGKGSTFTLTFSAIQKLLSRKGS